MFLNHHMQNKGFSSSKVTKFTMQAIKLASTFKEKTDLPHAPFQKKKS